MALATMLGVRLQHIEATLRQPEPAGELSGSQRAELERQQEAIKRALALAEQATQPPMVVDATLRQLLGPLAAVLSPAESGVDHLA